MDKSEIALQKWTEGTPSYKLNRALEKMAEQSRGVCHMSGDGKNIAEYVCVLLNREKDRLEKE